MNKYAFLVLKDFECAPDEIVAHALSVVPRSLNTPEYPTISIWLRNVREPITILYDDEESREKDLVLLRKAIEVVRFFEPTAN